MVQVISKAGDMTNVPKYKLWNKIMQDQVVTHLSIYCYRSKCLDYITGFNQLEGKGGREASPPNGTTPPFYNVRTK